MSVVPESYILAETKQINLPRTKNKFESTDFAGSNMRDLNKKTDNISISSKNDNVYTDK